MERQHEKNDKNETSQNKYGFSNIIQINEELSALSNINIDDLYKCKTPKLNKQRKTKCLLKITKIISK